MTVSGYLLVDSMKPSLGADVVGGVVVVFLAEGNDEVAGKPVGNADVVGGVVFCVASPEVQAHWKGPICQFQ